MASIEIVKYIMKTARKFTKRFQHNRKKAWKFYYLCGKHTKTQNIMAEIKEMNIEQLVFDDKNFNKHTEFGMSLIEKSIRKHGGGRSILIDKNNRIIGGNGVVETAVNVGLKDVIVVETDGTKLVAVKRNDVDLNTEAGREMALADNATAAVDLSWDEEQIQFAEEEFGMVAEEWGVFLDDVDVEQEKQDTRKGFIKMSLMFSQDEFDEVTEALSHIAEDKETALLTLIRQ